MFTLANIFNSTINKFSSFYSSLTDSSRFAFFAIIILIIIIAILVVILIDQFHQNKKIIAKNLVNQSTPSVNNKIDEDLFNSGSGYDEENEKTKNLKEITDKIQEVIDNRNIDLTKFEQEQEENSIISYDDLLKTVGKQKEETTPTEKFKLPELARKIEADEIIEKEEPLIDPEAESKFKTSDFISPIFGVQNKAIKKHEIDISEVESKKMPIADDTEIIDFGINNNDEEQFLNGLKNLRSNLN